MSYDFLFLMVLVIFLFGFMETRISEARSSVLTRTAVQESRLSRTKRKPRFVIPFHEIYDKEEQR